MADPATVDEFNRLWKERQTIEGYGLDLTQHVPCPFCAAPDFDVWKVVAGIAPGDTRPNLDSQMSTERTCRECGRSGRHIVVRDAMGVSAEFVQTGGPDPPEWLTPPPRRV